jgi:hypothetical protein
MRAATRLAAAALGVAALGAAWASPAGAAPEGDVFTLECDTLGTFDVVTFSNGQWSAALATESTRVVVFHRLHFDVTSTPVGGEPQSFVVDLEHPAPRHGRLDHCTLHEVLTGDFGVTELTGDADISYTPAP